MKWLSLCALVFGFAVTTAQAQLQVELRFKRLEYIAYEPINVTLVITNLAGRDVELHDDNGQHWFNFEVTAAEGRLLPPTSTDAPEPPLNVPAGDTVTRKINLTPIYPVQDFGTYHVRANVYFADLNKFFYSERRVFEVTTGKTIWQKTVGAPENSSGAGGLRTLSLLTNRFPNYTAIYVRAEDKSTGVVFNSYSLGHVITFDEPQIELDRANELHVLHCAAPRIWTYSHIGLNGELLQRVTYAETKTRPRFRRSVEGAVIVTGGMIDAPVAASAKNPAPKLSTRPTNAPRDQ